MIKPAISQPVSMGWTTCAQCENPFLSVLGARVRCPGCGHVFCCESVEFAKPRHYDESKPSGKQWLLRIEIQCARAWAEAAAAADIFPAAEIAEHNRDAFDFSCAWQQCRALRFGQKIDFVYGAAR